MSPLLWTGRTTLRPDGGRALGFPGTVIAARFTGSRVALDADAASANIWWAVSVDGAPARAVRSPIGRASTPLADCLDPDAVHTLRLVRRTESWQGGVTVYGLTLTGGDWLPAPEAPRRCPLFVGDSITCGAAAERDPPDYPDDPSTSNADAGFGHELGRRLDAQVHLVGYGGRGFFRDWQGNEDDATRNARVFFERALPDGPPIPWDHGAYSPDAAVELLARIHEVHPDAPQLLVDSPILVGDPTRGPALTAMLQTAAERSGATFVPVRFQPGTPADGHPTAAQHRAIADDIEGPLRAALEGKP